MGVPESERGPGHGCESNRMARLFAWMTTSRSTVCFFLLSPQMEPMDHQPILKEPGTSSGITVSYQGIKHVVHEGIKGDAFQRITVG